MKFGYSIPSNRGFTDVGALIDLAVKAETLGLDGVWASEHLFHSSYIADRLGDLPYYEPLTILTAAAMKTSRVRLGTSVLVLPWHDPPRLGKTVATLDHLSGGRVDLGVGVAHTEDEFRNLGVDFKSRGRRANEILAALQALWTQETPSYEGEFYRYEGLKFEPKPLQRPYPPILIGGSSIAAFRRIVRYGDGWHTLRQTPSQIAEALPKLKDMMADAGRDPERLRVSISVGLGFRAEASRRPPGDRVNLAGTAQDIVDTVAAFVEAGVEECVVNVASLDKTEHEDALGQLMADVRPKI